MIINTCKYSDNVCMGLQIICGMKLRGEQTAEKYAWWLVEL